MLSTDNLLNFVIVVTNYLVHLPIAIKSCCTNCKFSFDWKRTVYVYPLWHPRSVSRNVWKLGFEMSLLVFIQFLPRIMKRKYFSPILWIRSGRRVWQKLFERPLITRVATDVRIQFRLRSRFAPFLINNLYMHMQSCMNFAL